MSQRVGNISVHTKDIFPIIKKWLYSEHDIFLRELIANATDAITKRATIARTKNLEIPTGKITVEVSKKNKTITITDNGIGMTEDEVEKYIAQLAFSGAEEFVKQLESLGDVSKSDIIGKFGLGFYSSFMVSSKVEVDSLSMQEGQAATHWSCEGDTKYTFSESDQSEVGTKITLHVNDDGEEFLNVWKVRSTLKNFCDFMPEKIFVIDADEEKKDEEVVLEPLNDTEPLWRKDPKSLKDQDYIDFFRKLYPTEADPLFWIHLKVDHPFTLEGILYFPKLNPHRPFNESNIKLYCKQVFVSDNVKNIIPEFLSLLKGTIDSTDIPLNVSRSSLQGDPNIRKISNYVVKKVAEALKKLNMNDQERYQSIWEDIGLFIKYGVISDGKFDELMRERVIFKNSDGKYVTLGEYQESIPADYKEKLKGKVVYFEKNNSDSSLRRQLLDLGIQCIEVDEHIDPHLMQHIEMKSDEDKKLKFVSLDSEVENLIETEAATDEDMKIKDLFTSILAPESKTKEENKEEAFQNGLTVEISKTKTTSSPAYFKTDEAMKRFQHMAKSMGQASNFPVKKTLVINPNNSLVQNAYKIWEKGTNKELATKLCHHVEDLAQISSEGLKEEDKDAFISRTQNLLEELSQFAL